jgi:hypothetical protein
MSKPRQRETFFYYLDLAFDAEDEDEAKKGAPTAIETGVDVYRSMDL